MTLHLVSYIYITTLNIAFQDFYAKKVKITTMVEISQKCVIITEVVGVYLEGEVILWRDFLSEKLRSS